MFLVHTFQGVAGVDDQFRVRYNQVIIKVAVGGQSNDDTFFRTPSLFTMSLLYDTMSPFQG
ncbi:MAG: hypothetical protein B6D35_14185 [Candidatus Brocadia sp. UTAMX2]|nr:MAG: hypothetical protein B6D35_14185 [Candidatus Brocadia sp. UTAMX2]